MKVEKDKRKVSIVCQDGSIISGYVHIFHGERLMDFINDTKESFIPVTNCTCYNSRQVKLFQVFSKKSKDTVFLNKSAILFMKEV